VALGVGSNLVDRRAIAERDWRRLTTLAQSFRESVDHARQVIVKKGRARVSR
jgi:2-keto-3-deoxy-6-phosphogluconate aldolase